MAILGLALLCGSSVTNADGGQLHGVYPHAVDRLTPLRPTNPANHLQLVFGLPLRNDAALTTLLHDLYNPASPQYRHFLTPQQFAAQFGPTEADYQAVITFAHSHGLIVTGVHTNRVIIDIDGSVSDVEKALHVTMHDYNHPSENRTFYAPDSEPTIDPGVPITDVRGLDDYSLPHPYLVPRPVARTSAPTPAAGSGTAGTYAGGDFRAAYVPGTTLTGTGQSIGLLEFDGYYPSDITSYETQFNVPQVPLKNVAVNGGISKPGSNNDEVSLDIEMAASMAPGLTAIYVYEAPSRGQSWYDLLDRMVTDNLCKELSCSWGGGGPSSSAETLFKQMAAQGQSFLTASGDADAYTGSIPFPADSPNVTAVGGTTLTTSGPLGSYQSETVWNWGYDSQSSSYVGSSGGVSTYYSIPSYQQGVSMTVSQGSTTYRNVPDVALTADNIFVDYGNGNSGTFGGTSAAAPLWAGFMALVNQQALANGQSTVGFLNPTLYTIAAGTAYTSNFHDTTTGNNFSSSSPTKYSAVTGYDLCTGLGTPGGTTLINTLAGTPAASVSTSDSPAMPAWALIALGVILLLVVKRHLARTA
jgi:subtilase family serine protease